MKKFMFSTVAMVLFSMNSFGNEVFIEEADVTTKCVDCYQVAANTDLLQEVCQFTVKKSYSQFLNLIIILVRHQEIVAIVCNKNNPYYLVITT